VLNVADFVESEHTATGWPTMESVSYMTIPCDDLEASMDWPPSFEALEIGSYRFFVVFVFVIGSWVFRSNVSILPLADPQQPLPVMFACRP